MVELTRDELLEHLKEQYNFLVDSSNAYDLGKIGEAKRLAVVIRVLVHDTDHSTSLLKHLGKKDIKFYDTSTDYNPNNILSYQGLVIMKITTGRPAEYVAPLNRLSPSRIREKVSFDVWWNTIVFKDSKKNIFKRCDIVKTLANKEGGAHIDYKLNNNYTALTKFNSLGWKSEFTEGGLITEVDLGNPVLPSMRQISYEMIKTLRVEFAYLTNDNSA